MNGASEAILEDLLRQAQITNAHLANMLRQGAATGGGTSGGMAGGLTKSLGIASIAVGAVSAVFNTLSNVVGYVTNVIGQTASKMVEFGKAAAEGSAKLSDLFRVFDQLPIVGKVFDLFAQIVSYQESLLTSYRSLTQAGASFSGNLYQMRTMAYSAYMTLDEFGKVVRDNSSLFATSIGGVDGGLKTFAETQRRLVNPNSEMGRSLAGLGVTAAEAGDMLGIFMRMQGNMSKLDKMGSDAMAQSTGGLIKQLDAYSKLTGESRDAMAKQLKDRAFDEQKKMFLSALNPQERAQAEAALLAASQMGGKGLEDEVAVRLMSNNQIKVAGTEAANNLRITTRNSSATVADILSGLKDLKPGSQEAVAALQAARSELSTGTGQFMSAVGGPGRAGILSFFAGLKFATEQSKTYNQTIAAANSSQLSEEDRRKLIFEAQKKQYEGNAAALAAAELRIKMFGAQIGVSFLQLVSKLQPAIDVVSNALLNIFGKAITTLSAPGGVMDKFGKFLQEEVVPRFQDVVNWLTDAFGYLSSSEDMATFWSRLGGKLKEGGAKIWDYIGPPLSKMWNENVKPLMAQMFAGMLDWIITALRKNSKIARFLFDETETERTERLQIETSPEYKRLIENATAMNAAAAAGAGEFYTGGTIDYDAILRQAKEEIERKKSTAPVAPGQRQGMSTGTLGTMGSLFADFGKGTDVTLHGKEAVVTPSQMSGIVNNSLAAGIETLNMQVAELIRSNKEIANYARRNVDATRSLSGDLFAA